MGVNRNSYRRATIARFPEADIPSGDVSLRLDDDVQAHRVRLSVAESYRLMYALRDALASYATGVQSPISSGMGSRDGSPMDGKSV